MTTRDEVLAMAEQAGFTPLKDEWVFIEMLERFHALAVAKEREECAKICDDQASLHGSPGHAAERIRARSAK